MLRSQPAHTLPPCSWRYLLPGSCLRTSLPLLPHSWSPLGRHLPVQGRPPGLQKSGPLRVQTAPVTTLSSLSIRESIPFFLQRAQTGRAGEQTRALLPSPQLGPKPSMPTLSSVAPFPQDSPAHANELIGHSPTLNPMLGGLLHVPGKKHLLSGVSGLQCFLTFFQHFLTLFFFWYF